MINAYKNNKDLYATIASGVYKNTYWDNMEHYEDGSPNPEGKKRRNSVKSLLLG
jgi:DNA polymerase I